MRVRQIVKEYLEINGYDGLCDDFCSCKSKDLLGCHDVCAFNCRAGNIKDCKECSEYYENECQQGNDYCIEEKEEENNAKV